MFFRETSLMPSMISDHPIRRLRETEIDILKYLGSGGEGKVWLGRITELNQLIAIKQFEVIENQKIEAAIMEAVKKEMSIVKSLNHPNVIKFYTIHKSNMTQVENGVQYNILMEYMDGGALDGLLNE